jgi:hypothetical protein
VGSDHDWEVNSVSALARKNLLMITKLLQKLCNGQTFSESAFICLNPFIEKHLDRVFNFLDAFANPDPVLLNACNTQSVDFNLSTPEIADLVENSCAKLKQCLKNTDFLKPSFFPGGSVKIFPAEKRSDQTKEDTKIFVMDETSQECKNCSRKFGLLIRKHNCRNCGGAFCSSCAAGTAFLPRMNMEARVCSLCYREIVGEKHRKFID